MKINVHQFSHIPTAEQLRQHRTMGAAGFGGSFAPIVQYEKWEIHKVFPHFPYFRLGQNLAPNLLAPLCGIALSAKLERVKYNRRYKRILRSTIYTLVLAHVHYTMGGIALMAAAAMFLLYSDTKRRKEDAPSS